MSLLRFFLAVWAVGLAVLVLGPLLTSETAISWRDRKVASDFPSDPDAGDLATLRRVYISGQANWPAPEIEEGVEFVELGALRLHPNPEGRELQKLRLGQKLFEDPILSASGQIACQSCHNRELGWGDALRVSFGHARKSGTRNAPSLFTAGYRSSFFWDGRATSLAEQANGPLFNPIEMANAVEEDVVARLNGDAEYSKAFSIIYGGDGIVLTQVTDALSVFQKYLERPTQFDAFANGSEDRLSDEQIWGLHLFRGKAGCANCHYGPLLSDEKRHNIGLTFFLRRFEDLGLYEATRQLDDVGKFRTPSLRHLASTAPYMHNGVMPRLRNVIAFYEQGGGRIRPRNEAEAANPLWPYAAHTSPFLHALDLTARERDALLAFLDAL